MNGFVPGKIGFFLNMSENALNMTEFVKNITGLVFCRKYKWTCPKFELFFPEY